MNGVRSVRDEIFSNYDSLYDAEKKVADYVINYPNKAIEMSVSELSAACDASQATIIRFCKKVGCSGFHQLKIKLAGELNKQEVRPASNEIDCKNMEQSLHNIFSSKVDELKSTFENFDPKQIEEIVFHILNADVIEFAAVGNTIPIALDGVYKFNQLGLHAVGSTIWETQEVIARNLREGDLIFAISGSGASKRLLEMVHIAKEKRVITVAITNQPKSPIAEKCDYVILTATREAFFHDQLSFTRMSAMAVIDTLFLLLFSAIEKPYSKLLEHEQSVSDEKL